MSGSGYKERRQAAGYRYVGFWVTEAQERIIRSMLSTMEEYGMSPQVELMERGGWRPRKKKESTEDTNNP